MLYDQIWPNYEPNIVLVSISWKEVQKRTLNFPWKLWFFKKYPWVFQVFHDFLTFSFFPDFLGFPWMLWTLAQVHVRIIEVRNFSFPEKFCVCTIWMIA